MIRKLITWTWFIFFVLLVSNSTRALLAQQKATGVISLCQLISQSDRYFGTAVTLRVRVKIYRHGTSISDDVCPKSRLLLVTNQPAEQVSSVSYFYQFLGQHRQSSKPIFATITGHLVKGSSSGFVLKRDFDFELDSVSDLSEGNKVSGP
jgi:hypothetical protein